MISAIKFTECTTVSNSIPTPQFITGTQFHINILTHKYQKLSMKLFLFTQLLIQTYLKSWDLVYHPQNRRPQNIPIFSNSYFHHFCVQVWEQTPFLQHRRSQPLVSTCTQVQDQLNDLFQYHWNSLTKSEYQKVLYTWNTFLFIIPDNNVTILFCNCLKFEF